jgi:hypothetical protein
MYKAVLVFVALALSATRGLSQQVERYPSLATGSSAWQQPDSIVGNPGCASCDCNTTNAPYARNFSSTDVSYLTALAFGSFGFSDSEDCITEVAVDIMARYDTDDVGASRFAWEYRVGSSGPWVTKESPSFVAGNQNCVYRLGSRGIITNDRVWTASDLEGLQIRVKRVLDGSNSGLRVRTIRVTATARPRGRAPGASIAVPSSLCSSQVPSTQL